MNKYTLEAIPDNDITPFNSSMFTQAKEKKAEWSSPIFYPLRINMTEAKSRFNGDGEDVMSIS